MSRILKQIARPSGRTLLLLVVPVVLVALAGCQPEAESQEAATTTKPKNVRVLQLAPDTLEEFFELSGPVVPVKGTDISAQESGPVVEILAAKGAVLKAGDPILELDRKILKAEMESAQQAHDTQAYNLDKVEKLFDAKKVSRIELLTTRSQYQAARAQAKISTERYERALITAPFDCVLADRYVELGQMVVPGQPVVRCIDPYTLKLEGYLTADQVGWAKPGTVAAMEIGDNGTTAVGTVTWVGLEADLQTGKFKVEIELPNQDLALQSGVIGRARISKNIVRDVVTIPLDAVIKGRHGPEVFVAREGKAERVAITLGPDEGRMVVVTDGLTAGDLLVVRGQRDLVDDSLLNIVEKAAYPDGSADGDPAIGNAGGSGGQQ